MHHDNTGLTAERQVVARLPESAAAAQWQRDRQDRDNSDRWFYKRVTSVITALIVAQLLHWWVGTYDASTVSEHIDGFTPITAPPQRLGSGNYFLTRLRITSWISVAGFLSTLDSRFGRFSTISKLKHEGL